MPQESQAKGVKGVRRCVEHKFGVVGDSVLEVDKPGDKIPRLMRYRLQVAPDPLATGDLASNNVRPAFEVISPRFHVSWPEETTRLKFVRETDQTLSTLGCDVLKILRLLRSIKCVHRRVETPPSTSETITFLIAGVIVALAFHHSQHKAQVK